MLVSDVLNLVANLSIGLDSPTPDDQIIWLRYLNLAHFELYRHTAPVNPFLTLQTDTLNVNNGVVDALSQPIFAPRTVYRADINQIIQPYSLDKVLQCDPGLQVEGEPKYWYYANNSLNVWPLWTQANGIGVIYNTRANIFQINEDVSIYYPLEFHTLLADGTAYYLFQSEVGFKNDLKMQKAKDRWNEGKTNIYNYFVTVSGKPIYSTYSRI